MVTFYLGTHETHWLRTSEVPLFISRRRLARVKSLPRARTHWALDSGGFTELSMHGRWTVSAKQYAREAQRFQEEIGLLDWCAPQDMMCEPWITKKTGLSVKEHQYRTVLNLLELRSLAPNVRFIPVLQGWEIANRVHGGCSRVCSYMRHVEMYQRHGINLESEPTVGIGTMCRRQSTAEAKHLVQKLWTLGIERLHCFGMKTGGLLWAHPFLESADSMAWSFVAFKEKIRLEGCEHDCCGSCLHWALQWRERLLARVVADKGKGHRWNGGHRTLHEHCFGVHEPVRWEHCPRLEQDLFDLLGVA